ncbi:chromosome partitioning protein [Micromonospora sp. HM134]|nr:chromosome partitioning protein [Micromonospora sp. HM134]
MDDNADRAGQPGQQPGPERDIEPLWPPDPVEPVPHWAAEPTPVYPPTAYPSLAAEVAPLPPDGGWGPPGDGWVPDLPEPTPPTHLPPRYDDSPGYDPPPGYASPGYAAPADRGGAGRPTAPAGGTGPGRTGRVDLDLPFTLDPSLAGPPAPPAPVAPSTAAAPPAGGGHGVGPSTSAAPTPPPNSPSHPAPPSPPRNGSVVAHGDDPTELNLGKFGPPAGPKSSKIPEADPAVVAAVPAQYTGRGESPWALPPQRLSTGIDEPDRATGPATAPVRGVGHPQAAAPGPGGPVHVPGGREQEPGGSTHTPGGSTHLPGGQHEPTGRAAVGPQPAPEHPTAADGTPHPAPAGPPPPPPAAAGPGVPGGFRPEDTGPDRPEPTAPGRPEPTAAGPADTRFDPPGTGSAVPGPLRPESTDPGGPGLPTQPAPGLSLPEPPEAGLPLPERPEPGLSRPEPPAPDLSLPEPWEPGLSLPEQPVHGYPAPGQQPGPGQPVPGPHQAAGQQTGPQQAAGQAAPGPQPAAEPPAPGQQVAGGWYRPSWPEPSTSGGTPPPTPVYPDPLSPAGYPEMGWSPESGIAPTAEDFARRRQIRPAEPIATMGVRAMVNKIGLVKLPPGQHEQEVKRDIEMVRRNFGGLRQVTVVNPKGGAGKTVAILLLAMTFGQKRGGYVLAWDNNETQGTLGMRAQQDFHSRTVRDMLRDLGQFQGPHGRIGDLSQYVRSQGEGMFDVLASDESATGGEMLTAAAFAEIREVVSRFYKLIFVDTGNNVRAQNWQAAMDATDQLVVTMSARNDSAETAARMLDHLEQSGRHRLVRQAVTVVSMPPSRKEIDLPAIQEHFAARTRAVLLAPYERLIDTGEPIRYGGLSSATRDAWLKIAAAVAEGL